jgi:hypothetical protein
VGFTAAGKPALAYRGLVASDARGRALRAWLVLRGRGLLVRVDARGARYPVRIDPLFQNGTKLTGSGAIGTPNFGASVAFSADGATALIGGPYDNTNTGAAWVFTRSGAIWSQQGPKLTATDETGNGYFGISVALSSDGNTALIGGSNDNSAVGAAWVFTRSGAAWTQQATKLLGNCTVGCGGPSGTGETGAGFLGSSVALSSDGNTALIGASRDNNQAGAAWVFTRSGGVWSQQGTKLRVNCTAACTGPDGTGEMGPGNLGVSVALSGDGNTALIGAYQDNFGVGGAWVFVRSAGAWSQQGSELTGTGANGNANFGAGVALSTDGATALIGGPVDHQGVGAAWIFTSSGSVWSQQGSKLTATDAAGTPGFGASVALASDASRALIGGNQDGNKGAAWIFGPPPPTAKITSPADGGKYILKQSVHTSFSCTAGSLGPAIKTCKDSGGAAAPAGKLDTSTAGPHSYTATATSLDGATGTATIQYTVQSNTSRPRVSGNPLPGNLLTCSNGTWTYPPATFAYKWNRDGRAIMGATRHTYTVQIADEGHLLSCTVTASGPGFPGLSATSSGILVAVKGTLHCPKPTGQLSGLALGPLKLGMTQATARHALRRFAVTNGFDDFCLFGGWGIRVAYPTSKLLSHLSASERARVAGRVVIALTANPFYALNGVRPGMRVAAVARKLKVGKPLHIGLNDWYIAPGGVSNGVLKVRGGVIQEIGIVDKRLTKGRGAQGRLLAGGD